MPNHLENTGSTTKSLLSLFTKPTQETLLKALLLVQMVQGEGINSTIESGGATDKPWSPSDVIGPVGMLCGSLFLYHIWNEFIAPCLSAYEDRKRGPSIQKDIENNIELQSMRALKKKRSDPELVVVVEASKSAASQVGCAAEQEEESLVIRQKIKK